MKTTSSSPASSLASQFAAWRKRQIAAKIGALALVSLSTVRAVEQMEAESAAAFASDKVTERATDDSTATGDEFVVFGPTIAPEIDAAPARGLLLSRAEREELENVRPSSVSVVFRKVVAVVEISEPLDPGFVAAPVADFVSAVDVTLSPAELAEIERESAAEIAEIEAAAVAAARIAYATAFRSDFEVRFSPVDYSPDAGAPRQLITMRARCAALAPVVPTPTPAVAVDVDVAQMDFAALRAAVLATAGKRRK